MRIGIFVDGSNMYHAGKRDKGWPIGWDRVLAHFGKQGQVTEAVHFTTTPPDTDAPGIVRCRRFEHAIRGCGWEVVSKKGKIVRDRETGKRRMKANVDVELTCRALQCAANYDWAIIFTGDGDFVQLMKDLRDMGKRVSCAAWAHEVGREIREARIEIIDLAPLRSKLEYKRQRGGPFQRPPRQTHAPN